MRKRFITDLFIIISLIAIYSLITARSRLDKRPHNLDNKPSQARFIDENPQNPQDKPSTLVSKNHQPTGTSLNFDLPPEGGVQIIEEQGNKALLHINMEGHPRLALELGFTGPAEGWAFNLGDSNTNNGWGGDSSTAINDAEIQILDGKLEIFGSDLLEERDLKYRGGQRFLARWPNVTSGENSLVRIEIADGEVTYIDPTGERDTFRDPALFALAGQPDEEAGVNYDLYLGVNRVVYGLGRTGNGLASVRLRYLPQ